MATCAFLVSAIELSYFEGLIKSFPPDFIDILVGEHKLEWQQNLLQSGQVSEDFYHTIASLRESGFNVTIATNESLKNYSGILASAGLLVYKESPWIDIELLKTKRVLWLYHASDQSAYLEPPARYVIGQFQRSLEAPENGKVLKTDDPALFNSMTALPESQRGEYTYTGPYHLGEWEQKRLEPKCELKKELCEYLGIDIPDKPIIAFFKDEFCYEPELAIGLKALSNHVTVIYKGYEGLEYDKLYPSIKDCVIRWPSRRMAQNLLRFSVDMILSGYQSGTMTSSAMLGIPMIACHTTHVQPKKRRDKLICKFTPEHITGNSVTQRIHSHLDVSYNINNTEGILSFIEQNKGFSHTSDEENIAKMRPVFGDYCISGAAQKTAILTIRALSSGSFGKDTFAIKDLSA
ncbi:hypothetical protein [Maridesulfovibrio sp.]|uniref:hypothetical protein n=1 Tax=Maridesulfovibrio sp. TaxID=2795000 RepID=UPI003BAA8C2B